MYKNIRRSDSLAHATGSLLTGLEEINEKWGYATESILNLSPKILYGIQEVINSKGKNGSKKEEIISYLAKLGDIFNEIQSILAEKVDIMVDMEGLDFPLKSPKKIISLSNKEENIIELLQTVTHNLSKTMVFVGDTETDVELLENSLSSFRTALDDFAEVISEGNKQNEFLKNELEKEHKKARKYSDMV